MATFALVHGAWHGPWCFETLRAELETLGHEAVAPKLPSEDPSATLAGYAGAIAAALDGADDEPIVVGHSLGGIWIPLVPTLRPVRLLVFLAAFVPRPGISADEEFERGEYELAPDGKRGRDSDELGRSHWVDEAAAVETLFHDCPPPQARSNAARLGPQEQSTSGEPSPLDAWPAVPSTYIRCTADRMYPPSVGPRMAARVGAETLEIDTGHSPFCARPGELAALLESAARAATR